MYVWYATELECIYAEDPSGAKDMLTALACSLDHEISRTEWITFVANQLVSPDLKAFANSLA